jgi:hypothetical protein
MSILIVEVMLSVVATIYFLTLRHEHISLFFDRIYDDKVQMKGERVEIKSPGDPF